MKTKQKTFTATEFKAKCLRVLEELDSQGIVVLKRGRPIAKVTRISSGNNAEFFGCMRGKIKIKGDLFSTGLRWNAQS